MDIERLSMPLGHATRAVELMLFRLAESGDVTRAYLDIDAKNAASLGVARSLGVREVHRYRGDAGRPNIRFALQVR